MTDIVGGEMSDNPPVSDIVLCDRIAEALKTADRRVAGFISYEERADAVIAELKLEKQTLNREMWAAAPNVHRYVTEWKADNETD
jgi:hypothetical protein